MKMDGEDGAKLIEVEVIKGRLAFTASHRPPDSHDENYSSAFYFTSTLHKNPPAQLLASIAKSFTTLIDGHLSDPELEGKCLVYYTGSASSPQQIAMTAILFSSFMVLSGRLSPEQAVKKSLGDLSNHGLSSQLAVSCHPVLTILRALAKADSLGWLKGGLHAAPRPDGADAHTHTLTQKNTQDWSLTSAVHGRLSLLRFHVQSGLSWQGVHGGNKLRGLAKCLSDEQASCVYKLDPPSASATRVMNRAKITTFDRSEDGVSPPCPDDARRFFAVCEKEPGHIVVQCSDVRGLNGDGHPWSGQFLSDCLRGVTLVALYLSRYHDFTPAEASAWLMLCCEPKDGEERSLICAVHARFVAECAKAGYSRNNTPRFNQLTHQRHVSSMCMSSKPTAKMTDAIAGHECGRDACSLSKVSRASRNPSWKKPLYHLVEGGGESAALEDFDFTALFRNRKTCAHMDGESPRSSQSGSPMRSSWQHMSPLATAVSQSGSPKRSPWQPQSPLATAVSTPGRGLSSLEEKHDCLMSNIFHIHDCLASASDHHTGCSSPKSSACGGALSPVDVMLRCPLSNFAAMAEFQRSASCAHSEVSQRSSGGQAGAEARRSSSGFAPRRTQSTLSSEGISRLQSSWECDQVGNDIGNLDRATFLTRSFSDPLLKALQTNHTTTSWTEPGIGSKTPNNSLRRVDAVSFLSSLPSPGSPLSLTTSPGRTFDSPLLLDPPFQAGWRRTRGSNCSKHRKRQSMSAVLDKESDAAFKRSSTAHQLLARC